MATEAVTANASVASSGLGLRYVGDRVYGFSGTHGNTTAGETLFDFTSGAGVIVGEFVLNGAVRFLYAQNGSNTAWQLSFNGEVIALYVTNSSSSAGRGESQGFQRVIIPPFTRVVLEADSDEDNAAELLTANFHGRVYGVE